MSTLAASHAPSNALRITLWIGQAILAAMFLFAGGMKLANAAQFPLPVALTYFIGISELAGGIGVIVPALTRIKPVLTPIAAAALGLVMILATGFHLMRSEPVGMTVGLAAVALFVAWGRAFKAPIHPR